MRRVAQCAEGPVEVMSGRQDSLLNHLSLGTSIRAGKRALTSGGPLSSSGSWNLSGSGRGVSRYLQTVSGAGGRGAESLASPSAIVGWTRIACATPCRAGLRSSLIERSS